MAPWCGGWQNTQTKGWGRGHWGAGVPTPSIVQDGNLFISVKFLTQYSRFLFCIMGRQSVCSGVTSCALSGFVLKCIRKLESFIWPIRTILENVTYRHVSQSKRAEMQQHVRRHAKNYFLLIFCCLSCMNERFRSLSSCQPNGVNYCIAVNGNNAFWVHGNFLGKWRTAILTVRSPVGGMSMVKLHTHALESLLSG